VASVNPEYDDSANDTGGSDDTLRPMEALDSDEVRNDDGDEVVDPPDDWVAADHIAEEPDGETLDEKLAAEEPDQPALSQPSAEPSGDTEVRSDDDIDHIDPERHGRAEGQIDGTPEDGDSLFPVVE
jgi:hypothetical protein